MSVFLSYRRSDTGPEAGRLSDRIRHVTRSGLVFRDVSDIPPGAQFDVVLEQELEKVRVVLALIGTTWVDELAQRQARNATDYVRVEVATALRTRKRVVPVLLRGASVPSEAELPADLALLAKCQAITLRDESWDGDVDRLLDAIGRPFRWGWFAGRALLAVFAVIVAVRSGLPEMAPDRTTDFGFIRAVVVALVLLYALAEWAIHLRRVRR